MSVRRWIVQSLASAATLAVLAGGASAQPGTASTKPAAVVDGMAIAMAEVEAVLKQAPPTATPLTEAQRRQMQLQAVGLLIDDLLMQQCMRKLGPRIELPEVNKRVADLQDALKKEGKTLEDFYKESGQNEAQLRSHIVTGLQWAAYVKEHVSDADVKRYYEESKDFWDRVSVRASHIVLRIPENASEAERQAALTKLQELRKDIVAGKIDFAEAAKKYSHCSSAPTGGDIGFFLRKLMVDEPFAKAAFALKVGEISEVVQTNYGLHLIKVTDRKAGQPADFNKIKDEVREMCVEELRMALLAEQRKTTKVEVNLP
jgi:peptidyl-prolyl cis-trans isomerase C